MFIVYKTTNSITNEFYIGSHKESKLDEKKLYLGSGFALKKQFETFSISDFKRETLYRCETSEEALNIEHKIIAENYENPLCLNRSNGGRNFEYINSIDGLNNSVNNCSLGGRAYSKKLKEDPEFAKEQSKKISNGLTPEIKAWIADKNKGNKHNLGKHHTEETKRKIGDVSSIHQRGTGNSQYGTYWITDGVKNMKWKDSKGEIPVNFYRGRIIKND